MGNEAELNNLPDENALSCKPSVTRGGGFENTEQNANIQKLFLCNVYYLIRS